MGYYNNDKWSRIRKIIFDIIFDKKNILFVFSLISIILGLYLIYYMISNIDDPDINDKIFGKDFYMVIGVLFLFGFWGSELIGLVKKRVQEYVDNFLETDSGKKILENEINKEIKNINNNEDSDFNDMVYKFVEDYVKEIIENKNKEYNQSETEKNYLEDIKEKDYTDIQSNLRSELSYKDTGKDVIKKFINTLIEKGIHGFTLNDAYNILEKIYKDKYPNNNFIEPKIRRLLQDIRSEGYIEFKGGGKYNIIEDK